MTYTYIIGIDFTTEKSTEKSTQDVKQLIEMIKTNLLNAANEAVKKRTREILEIKIERRTSFNQTL